MSRSYKGGLRSKLAGYFCDLFVIGCDNDPVKNLRIERSRKGVADQGTASDWDKVLPGNPL